MGNGDDVAWTSSAHAETGGRRHAGVRGLLREDHAGADRAGGARYTATDAVCVAGLRAGDGATGGGDEDLRGGRSGSGVRRRSERVAPYGPRSDEEVRGGGVGSSVRPTM